METANLISKRQIREIYESYTDYFYEIMAKVVERLQQNIKLSAQPTYKSRVKSFDSYYKKVVRLKPEQMEETKSLIYLTDMMGIRMICAFLEDINLGLEQIKKLFEIIEVADEKIISARYDNNLNEMFVLRGGKRSKSFLSPLSGKVLLDYYKEIVKALNETSKTDKVIVPGLLINPKKDSTE